MLGFNSRTARWGRAGLGGATRGFFGGAAGLIGFGHRPSYAQGTTGNLAFETGSLLNQGTRFGLSALGSGVAGLSGLPGIAGGYMRGQRAVNMDMREARRAADHYQRNPDSTRYIDSANTKLQGRSASSVADQFGRQADGHRKFGARGFTGHMRKGVTNTFKHGLFSSTAWGLNLGLAAFTAEGDFFDPYNGPARALASNVGAEIGAAQGMGVGAGLGALVGGPIGAAIGLVAGAVAGAELGGAVADLPWKMSEFGNKHGRKSAHSRSSFIDSEAATTMRQRSMQSIRRSQMSARSALGQEALAYHS
jgi:hypothetical protein